MRLSSSIDASLLDLFRAEIDTHLPTLSEGLLALEKHPGQTAPLAGLMRAAHSIKGAAKIVGVAPAVRVAHALEDCFVAAQEGRVTLASDAIDVLLRGVDALQRITALDSDFSDEELERLLEELERARHGVVVRQTPAASAPLVALGPPTLRPAGDLDAAAAEELRMQLIALLREGATEIRFDFTAVRDIDPAGLALLAVAGGKGGLSSRTILHIVNAAPAIRLLLEMTRLNRVYRLADEGR